MNFAALIAVSLELFIFLCLGFLLRKLGIADEAFTKRLSSFVAKVAQPFLIVYSIVRLDFSAEHLKNGALVFGFAVLAHGFMAAASALAFCRIRDKSDRMLGEFSAVFSNCGFVGLPILNALFGEIGIFYGAFYMIVFNLAVWSYGVLLMEKSKNTPVFLRNIFFNVGTVSSAVGLGIYMARLPLPAFLLSAMEGMAGLCTPLSLIVTGSLVAAMPLRKLLTNKTIYFFCGFKLIVLPLLAAVILRFLPLSGLISGIDLSVFLTLMIALPSAAFTTLFADMYDVKPSFAAQIVCASTMFSPITLLFVMKMTEYIL